MKTLKPAMLCMEMGCVNGQAVRLSLETLMHFSSESCPKRFCFVSAVCLNNIQ